MTKLEKKDGNVEQCPTCHKKIYCRMTKGSEKYPAKLQWQNEDGKAHYKFDFATKETSCNEDKVERSPNQPDIVTWPEIPDDEISPDMTELIIGEEWMIALAVKTAKKRHPSMSENNNIFGQIVNSIANRYVEMAKVKALKVGKK